MLKALQENSANTLKHTGLGKDCLNRTQITQEPAPRINRWDYVKFKSVYAAEGTIRRVNSSLTEWKKIFASHTLDRGLTPRIYKNLQKVNTKRIRRSISALMKGMGGSQEEKYTWTATVFKSVLNLQSSGKCKQSKRILRYRPPAPK